MKRIQTVLLSALYFGLVTTALPGCPDSQSEQSPEEQEQAICDKLAECGELSEGITAKQCAANLGAIYDGAQGNALCEPLLREMQTAMACVSHHASCEDSHEDTFGGGGPSKDHPCFEELESFRKAMEKAEKQDPESTAVCLFAYGFTLMAMTDGFGDSDPGHGAPCTTDEECPGIECASQEGFTFKSCLNGKCATQDDLCE